MWNPTPQEKDITIKVYSALSKLWSAGATPSFDPTKDYSLDLADSIKYCGENDWEKIYQSTDPYLKLVQEWYYDSECRDIPPWIKRKHVPTPGNSESRNKFELWILSRDKTADIRRYSTGEYFFYELAWLAWEESRKQFEKG